MHINLQTPRPSTLVLLGLVIAFLVSTPLPLAVVVVLLVWACHTPASFLAGIALVLAYKALHPKAAH